MGSYACCEVFDSRRLEDVFRRCFEAGEHTLLVGGADEPFYRPRHTASAHHLLYYREDFFASALHEVAHWCIAGRARRQLPDFGYWYAPEGRNATEQRAFEAVEVKPQALEWWFSAACGYRFRVSVDNFDPATGEPPDTQAFRQQVARQAEHWQAAGLPPRAARYFSALVREFGTAGAIATLRFDPEAIA